MGDELRPPLSRSRMRAVERDVGGGCGQANACERSGRCREKEAERREMPKRGRRIICSQLHSLPLSRSPSTLSRSRIEPNSPSVKRHVEVSKQGRQKVKAKQGKQRTEGEKVTRECRNSKSKGRKRRRGGVWESGRKRFSLDLVNQELLSSWDQDFV